MKSKTKITISAVAAVAAAALVWGLLQADTAFQSDSRSASPEIQSKSPAPGKVTMLDLGADKCRPCKMMAPILEELEKAYEDRAEIIFIDVWKNREVAEKYGIRAIPTQIFFNEEGEEVRRHTGFMDKKTIIKNLSNLGVTPPEKYRDS
ncbi:MAG: thioredoxin family protein [Desulfobacterales bacterium]|nr:thioredoxin family protein [Desulfobacterales bacterium]